MIYIPDQDIERFLLEDIAFGDLTTRSLGIGQRQGKITFYRREAGRVSGVAIVCRIMQKLGLEIEKTASADGADVPSGTPLVCGYGCADTLHQAWKVSQNVLEWSCGVANSMAQMIKVAREADPHAHIACTRKSIPGTKLLAALAVLDGGGIIHRCGTAETILLFANHRRFLPHTDWAAYVDQLKRASPEKKVVVEADNMDEAIAAMKAQPHIVQLDKFTPQEIIQCQMLSKELHYAGQLAAAGGINLGNIGQYAATGIGLLVTSSPYYSKPADIRVVLEPVSE